MSTLRVTNIQDLAGNDLLSLSGGNMTVAGSISAASLTLDGVAITADGSELNLLDGVTATTAELNYVDVAAIGVAEASKALVVDANKDLTGIRNLTVDGDLTVNGTTTTINSTTLSVDDKNIELGTVDTPTDTTANGGGFTLKGATDKTFSWNQTSGSWHSNVGVNITSGNLGLGTTSPNFLLHLDGGHMHRFRATAGTSATPHEDALVTYGSTTAPFGGMYAINQYSTDTRTDLAFKVTNNTGSIYEALRIRYDGNVGIGTTNPQVELHLDDADGLSRIRLSGGASSADTFEFGQGTTGATNGGFEIRDIDAAATRFVIDSSGNVGIGTTSPGATLQLGTETPVLRLNGTNDGTNVYGDIRSAGNGFEFISRGGAVTNGSFAFYNYNGTTESIALKISSGGNVGIGTATPRGDLDIAASSSEAANIILEGGSPEFWIKDLDQTFIFRQIVNANGWGIQPGTGGVGSPTWNSVALTLDETGNFGVGTTNPGSRLTVQQDQAAYSYFDFRNETAGGGVVWRQIVRNAANNGNTSIDFAKLLSGGFTINNLDTDSANYTGFQVGAAERLRIDSAGRLLHGTTAGGTGAFGTVPHFHTASAGSTNVFQNYGGSTYPARIDLVKTRGSTPNSHAIVQNGDTVGGVYFAASDGINNAVAAQIEAFVDGVPGENDMPGNLVFSTTADGAEFATQRMRITSAGKVGIGTNNPNADLHFFQKGETSANGFRISRDNGAASYTQWVDGFAAFNIGYSNPGSTNPSSSALVIDQNNNVGIATDPQAQFHTYLAAGSNGWRLRLQTNVNDGAGFYQRASGDFELVMRDANNNNNFISGESGHIVVMPSTHVGIGTNNPPSKLAVNGQISESTDGGQTYHNVVTEEDIGTAANQVPLNQFLGQMAFVDRVGDISTSSSDPQNNLDVNFEYVSNTSIKIRMRGTDGVVRSATLTLS